MRPRAIPEVVSLDHWRQMAANDLLSCNEREIFKLRYSITEHRNRGKYLYVCPKCGHGVYIAFSRLRRPYFKHFRGSPGNCPWFTGDSKSPDHIAALQFGGQQEGPLHRKLKLGIANALSLDSNADAVRVDEYFKGPITGESKKPDVIADYFGKRVAFEIQLATTQIPIIAKRNTFYRSENIYLIWVFWNFSPVRHSTYEKDTYYANYDNAFSVGNETFQLSEELGTLVLRVWWREPFLNSLGNQEHSWECETVTLADLHWAQNSNLIYFCDVPAKEADLERKRSTIWKEQIKTAWLSTIDVQPLEYIKERDNICDKIRHLLRKNGIYIHEFEANQIDKILDFIFSIEDNKIYNSRQSNLIEMANTNLNPPSRVIFTELLRMALEEFGRHDVLDKPSVRKKMNDNMKDPATKQRAVRLGRFLFDRFFPRVNAHPTRPLALPTNFQVP